VSSINFLSLLKYFVLAKTKIRKRETFRNSKTIIFYGCETWFLKSRQTYRATVFGECSEESVETTGDRITFRGADRSGFFFTQNSIGMISSGNMK
jgi:phage terminase large subunit